MEFLRMRVAVVHVGVRAHRDEHLCSILGEDHVAGPVTAAAQPASAGQIGQFLRGAARLQVTVLIRESHHGVRIPNVDPLRIGARRKERNPEGLA